MPPPSPAPGTPQDWLARAQAKLVLARQPLPSLDLALLMPSGAAFAPFTLSRSDCVRNGVSLGSGAQVYIFDELFHGTNSHDRSVGAESVLGGLIERAPSA